MKQKISTSTFFILIIIVWMPELSADIISTKFGGKLVSRIQNESNNDKGESSEGDLAARIDVADGYSSTKMDWMWRDNQFASSGTFEQLLDPNEPESVHWTGTRFFFEFTIDSAMRFELEGDWGFTGVTGTDDFISLTLVDKDTGKSIFEDSTNSGRATNEFSVGGFLARGTYRMELVGELNEDLAGRATMVTGEWNIGNFELTAVPEPAAVLVCQILTLGMACRRRRR